ncbi:MAG TPA: lipoyl(octanoyl) transferase LipB, partial [Candidatus Omnitrophota bacterium]|nr:lipoyl(octanoyl) transferase LipB [Candidatus Omnitrophota bacterium]
MHLIDLGLVDYRMALEEQRRAHAKVAARELSAALIVCSHYPVITIGRSAKPGSLLLTKREYAGRGIGVIEADRGGDVTYHGPGQVTAYPIFPMAAFGYDLHAYLRWLESAVISVLDEQGITACRMAGSTGVWVAERKIASIGIAVKRWVSFHGVSIVMKQSELENFSLIRPCGSNTPMTSIET